MAGKIPFIFNADLYNAFSFTKGNFVGRDVLYKAYK